jgi:hypothetical protein
MQYLKTEEKKSNISWSYGAIENAKAEQREQTRTRAFFNH